MCNVPTHSNLYLALPFAKYTFLCHEAYKICLSINFMTSKHFKPSLKFARHEPTSVEHHRVSILLGHPVLLANFRLGWNFCVERTSLRRQS